MMDKPEIDDDYGFYFEYGARAYHERKVNQLADYAAWALQATEEEVYDDYFWLDTVYVNDVEGWNMHEIIARRAIAQFVMWGGE
jgi:hypothetical protein